ncbi:MAG: diguanylate cyclase [Acidobacteria bacterium]|nr:diguanylate cyclase [Acidobacteriota bacterium]MCB9399504.1 diguanylate cyclase [Acidobacteriota bacterium]
MLAIGLSLLFIATPQDLVDRRAFSLPPNELILDTWNVDNGLTNARVKTLALGPDGFLWIGTFGGLVRFDGLNFNPPPGPHSALLSNAGILTLAIQADRIWVGTAGRGLFWIDCDGAGYPSERFPIPENVITSLACDQDRVWVGTAGGLYLIEPNRVQSMGELDPRFQTRVESLAVDAEKRVWVGFNTAGLVVWDHEKQQAAISDLDGIDVNQIRVSPIGSKWIATTRGVYQYLADGNRNFLADLPDKTVYELCEDRAGNLWIGTSKSLYFYNQAQSQFFERIGTSDVSSMVFDHEGGLWVGTFRDGLHRLSEGPITTFGKRHGLENGKVSGIVRRQNGELWISTVFEGAFVWRENRFELALSVEDLGVWQVRTMLEDAKGRLWIGGFTGLGWLDEAGFHRVTAPPGIPMDQMRIRQIHGLPDGTIWVATSSGPYKVVGTGLQPALADTEFEQTSMVCVLETTDGTQWWGTDGWGLLAVKSGKISHYRQKDGLTSDVILHLSEDRNGILWVGTNAGLSFFNQGRLVPVPPFADGSQPAVFQIVQDDDGSYWLTGERGVLKIREQALTSGRRVSSEDMRLYGKHEGLEGLAFNAPAKGFRDEDGTIWLPGMAGVVRIRKGQIQANPYIPPLAITAVWVDGEEQSLVQPIHLKKSPKTLEIHYTALSLRASESNRFRYRLAGFEDSWFDAGTRRVATFTKIPPGTFQFELQGTNNDQVWNEQGIQLELVVPPAFYQTTWFRALVLLLALGVMYLIYAQRVRSFQQQKQALEAEVAARTAELQSFNRELAAIDSIVKAINQGQTMEQVIGEMLLQFNQFFHGLGIGAFYWRNPDKDTFRLVYSGSPDFPRTWSHDRLIPLDSKTHQGSWCLGSWQVEPNRPAWSVLALRLENQGEGLLLVARKSDQPPFDPAEAAKLEPLAVHVRTAVSKVQMLENLREKQERLTEANRNLAELSVTDPLTGLNNRRFLMQHLPEKLETSLRRYRQEGHQAKEADLIFFLVDLDHFKKINDVYGHPSGDLVLQKIAAVMLKTFRTSDMIVRWGGEEFLIVCRFMTRADASEMAERLRDAVARTVFESDRGESIQVTCSIGFAPFPFLPDDPEAFDWNSILQMADAALYFVKTNGRNGWAGIQGICDPMSSPIQFKNKNLHYESKIRGALVETE